MIDIRLPIGGLFSVLGVMLVGYGLVTHGNEMYVVKSLGYNINIWWGLVMLAFGATMLFFGIKAGGAKNDAAADKQGERSGNRH